jgi:RimJ/RimL family protein N-acetyltransferase
MEIELKGKSCVLREWNENHLETLYAWRNSRDYLEFCSLRKSNNSFDEFKQEFYHDLTTDRQDQHIIFRIRDNKPIGTIFLYGLSTFHENGFVTTFIEDSLRNKGYGIEAFALFCDFILKKYSLHKLIVDVYSHNGTVTKMLRAGGFKQEGYFKEHRKNANNNWLDVVRLSLFKRDTSTLDSFHKLFERQSSKLY